jgi:prephenate dehydrogenase
VAEAGLYRGAPFVLCPLPRTTPQTVTLATALALAVGACPLALDPVHHDRLAAAISHVPYLASLATFAAAADVALADPMAWRLAASGFRSTTRLAGSDPTMMADILLSNREAVLAQLDRLQSHLAALATLLIAADDARLRGLAASARAARNQFLEQYGT